MVLRRIILTSGLTFVLFAAFTASAAVSEANVPAGPSSFAESQDYLWDTYLSGGVLYVGSNSYGILDYDSSNNELQESSNLNDCLYYNQDNSDFDIVKCDPTKTSDQFKFGSNSYSEWSTLYNGDCVWALGSGTKAAPGSCDGDAPDDRWHWVEAPSET